MSHAGKQGQIVGVTINDKTRALFPLIEQTPIEDLINTTRLTLPPVQLLFSPPLVPLSPQIPPSGAWTPGEGFQRRLSSASREACERQFLQIQISTITRIKQQISAVNNQTKLQRNQILTFLVLTFILFPGMRGSPLRLVMPGEDGKLRLGGGGGGDLEGFSVR